MTSRFQYYVGIPDDFVEFVKEHNNGKFSHSWIRDTYLPKTMNWWNFRTSLETLEKNIEPEPAEPESALYEIDEIEEEMAASNPPPPEPTVRNTDEQLDAWIEELRLKPDALTKDRDYFTDYNFLKNKGFYGNEELMLRSIRQDWKDRDTKVKSPTGCLRTLAGQLREILYNVKISDS